MSFSYWESINSHLQTYKSQIEDNNFKSLSCQVRNNMETTLHVNDYRFRKQENEEITIIDWRID